MKRLLIAMVLAAALAGCTQKVAPPAATPPVKSDVPTPAAPETPAAEPQPAPAAAAPAVPAAAITTPAQPLAGHWQVDKNYHLILPPQPTSVDAGQVEIIEFMWLGCPHCYELNPYVEAWKSKLPAYVKFQQEHVIWDAQRKPHARLFYTLQALGGGDKMVVKAFDEIHGKRNPMMGNSEAATQQAQLAFAVANGFSAADFQREYNGFAVNTNMKRADELVRRYRIDQVPTFIVNGKYLTDVSDAGGPKQLMQLLTDLAAAEKGR